MKTILVPTDFSEEANSALDLAVQLAKKNNSKIILFHVVESYAHVYYSVFTSSINQTVVQDPEQEAFMAALLVQATRKLEETAKEIEGVTVETYVQVGNFYNHISKKITDKAVDLIIMGSHGTSSLAEEYVGSNTEKVVRFAKCPVISVKKPVSLDKIKNIALPFSLEEDPNDKVMNAIVSLQKLLHAKLHIVRINHLGSVLPHRSIMTRIENLVKKYHIENYMPHVYSDEDVESGIIHFAEDYHIDMITMGTHSRSGLTRIMSRRASVAEDVATHTKMLVWTYSFKN